MWGQVCFHIDICPIIRIIPTRVGTRRIWNKRRSSYRDHPHACGDKSATNLYYPLCLGSSPRVWGQGVVIGINARGDRIIPTRVGTSILGCIMTIMAKDHPHACGDKFINIRSFRNILGSSPRVWGQGRFSNSSSSSSRIIPTRVGTSITFVTVFSFTKDHPHACGDKIFCRMKKRGT